MMNVAAGDCSGVLDLQCGPTANKTPDMIDTAGESDRLQEASPTHRRADVDGDSRRWVADSKPSCSSCRVTHHAARFDKWISSENVYRYLGFPFRDWQTFRDPIVLSCE